MYGYQAYAEVGFSDIELVPLDPDEFVAFLDEVNVERCWTAEVDAFSLASSAARSGAFSDVAFSHAAFSSGLDALSGGEATLRWSSHGYTSHADDDPASTWFEGRLSDVRVERSIVGRDGVTGLTRIIAWVSFANTDGGLDLLTQQYAVDGRPFRLKVGRPSDAYADFGTAFTGVVTTVEIALDRVMFSLSDGIARLATPVQENTYNGLGGIEGGPDIAGKPKALCYGEALNVAPPLIDETRLIYQVHQHTIQDVTAVYDRGVALTKGADYATVGDLLSTAPSAGQYRVWKGDGCFRLGATPDGTVTADVEGDATGAGYVDTTGEIILRLLASKEFTTSDIDTGAFAQLATDAPATVGIYIEPVVRSAAEVIDELLAAIGAFGGFSRFGHFTVGVVAAPDSAVVARYTEQDIGTLAREPLPPALEPVVWRASVGYQKNYTVQDDLADSVPAARRAFTAQAERFSVAESAGVKSQHILARELVVPAFYALEADASTEAVRLFDLWSAGRPGFRVGLPNLRALNHDIGDVVELEHSRHGLAGGVKGRLMAHAFGVNAVDLRVLLIDTADRRLIARVDPDILLFVDPASGAFDDLSSHKMAATVGTGITIAGGLFNFANPSGIWSFPGDSINNHTGKESVTYEGFWEFAVPVPGAATLFVWQMFTTYGGPRIYRVESSLAGNAGNVGFGNNTTGLIESSDSPDTPIKCHVCVMYRGADDGTNEAFFYLDGVLQGSVVGTVGSLPSDINGSWRLCWGGSQCGAYKMGQFRCKLGLQYATAGFTPPTSLELDYVY